MFIKNKSIVITGAASGIGLGMVQYCLIHNVGSLFLLDSDKLAINHLQQCYVSEKNVHIITMDIRDEKAIKDLAESLFQDDAAIDMIINCAGVSGPLGPVWEVPVEQVDWALDINLKGTVNVARAFIPFMLKEKNKGIDKKKPQHFITVSSHLGLVTEAHLFAYQMTKHGVVAFTEALEKDLQQIKSVIQVAVFFPYFVQSNLANAERHFTGKEQAFHISPRSEAFFSGIKQETVNGIEPLAAAKILFDGIEANAFYIFTDDRTKQAFKQRVEHIFERSFPK